MPNRTLIAFFALVLSQFYTVSALSADENKKPESGPPPRSLQQQIDELKEGQQATL
jgi:hypothetical protein